MTIDKIIVTLTGTGLIGLIWWFFFSKKDDEVETSKGEVSITVEGGYKPSVIRLKKAKAITLKFTRTDSNSCLEEIIISDFKVKEYLPLNRTVEIEIIPKKSGVFRFQCGMNMYHGKIHVN